MMSVQFVIVIAFIGAFSTQTADANCPQELEGCIEPVIRQYEGMPVNEVLQRLIDTDFSETCVAIFTAKECIETVVSNCPPSQYPEHVRLGVEWFLHMVQFICVEEVNALNASKACLFNQQLVHDMIDQCRPLYSSPCIRRRHWKCHMDLAASRCGKSLMVKFRNFLRRVEVDIGCFGGKTEDRDKKTYIDWIF